MTDSLSVAVAAQAVRDAAFEPWQSTDTPESIAAAALRAAADLMVPDEPHPGESQFWDDEADREWQNNQHFRNQLLAIAAELERTDD